MPSFHYLAVSKPRARIDDPEIIEQIGGQSRVLPACRLAVCSLSVRACRSGSCIAPRRPPPHCSRPRCQVCSGSTRPYVCPVARMGMPPKISAASAASMKYTRATCRCRTPLCGSGSLPAPTASGCGSAGSCFERELINPILQPIRGGRGHTAQQHVERGFQAQIVQMRRDAQGAQAAVERVVRAHAFHQRGQHTRQCGVFGVNGNPFVGLCDRCILVLFLFLCAAGLQAD